MNIEALKEAHDLSLDGRDFAARQIILDVIADLEKKEPAGYADKIAFESAMKVGKGCDVWPVKGDYEARTGRALIALYTSPPAQQQEPQPPYEFERYVAGSLRAQGVRVERATTLADAMRIAAKICPPANPPSAPTVLVYTSPPAQRKPLTAEQRLTLFIELNKPCVQVSGPSEMFDIIVRAIEAAHQIGVKK